MKRIAVLITCFDRVKTTLASLESLFMQPLPEGYELEVFLVDDASPDKTGEQVKERYPEVHVIFGTGNLFWCKGMSLAWNTALHQGRFDYFLWMNDDVTLGGDAISVLIQDSERLPYLNIMGGCFVDSQSGEIFYGAPEIKVLTGAAPIEVIGPMHGNLVLIPWEVYQRIGGMSTKFTHQYGDFEYAIRAHRAGIRTFVAHKTVGTCKANAGFDKKKMLQMDFRKRCATINHPKGYGLMDYCRYKCYVKGWPGAVASFCKGMLILISPRLLIQERP